MAGFAVPITSWLFQGAAAASGTVDVYQTGTTTRVTIYSDAGLSTPITNPVTLDANGSAVFYVGSTVALRLDAKTSGGTLIRSVDPVQVLQDLSGFTGTGTDLNKIVGITNGTAAASKALVTDSSANISGLNTLTANTASSGIATMTAVQNSMLGTIINKFRNAGMNIAQRGLSGTITAGSPAYTLDGWIVGSTGANVTWNQLLGVGSATGNYYTDAGLQVTGLVSVTDTFIKQRIESNIAVPLSGYPVTFQAVIYNGTGSSITPTLTVKHATAADNWGATSTDVNAVSLQPCPAVTYTKVAYTFTASASSGNGLEILVDFGSTLTSNSKFIVFLEPDIRATPGVSAGLNSTPPLPEMRPLLVDLPYNQRYLPGFGTLAGPIGSGAATSTSASGYYIPFNVPTRVAPTALSVTTVGNFEISSYAPADVAALTGMTFSSAGPAGAIVTAAVAGTPLTSGTAYFLYAKTALAGNLIFTGAEL